MRDKYIIFDTNYINIILNDKNKYKNILDELKKEYNFSINIATFVELVQQKINNFSMLEMLIEFLNQYEIFVSEFCMNKCIEYKNFSFNQLKIYCKKDRKRYFQPIRDNFYDFLCKFISLYAEWIIYSLVMLLSENLNGNEEYKIYLNKKSLEFQKEFRKLYDQKKIRIKDKFNEMIYSELKKFKNYTFCRDKVLLQEIIKSFDNNVENMMYIFHANSKITKEIRNKFVEYFYETEIKPFLVNRFNNKIFEEYIKKIFQKLIIGGGKLDPNDIADALILASINNQDDVLITNDTKIIKFLEEKGIYKEEIYNKFKK